MRSEMKEDEDDRWNDDYFKRIAATTVQDFVRFNCMVAFDNGMNGHSSGMSRRQYALSLSESDRVVVSELPKNKKEMEVGDDESSHKKKKNKNKKKKKKKMEGGESESSQLSETDRMKMMIEQAGGYKFRLDPTNPEVQAKIAEMTKESMRRAILREKSRQAAAKALSDEMLVN